MPSTPEQLSVIVAGLPMTGLRSLGFTVTEPQTNGVGTAGASQTTSIELDGPFPEVFEPRTE